MSLKTVCLECEPNIFKWKNFKHLVTILNERGLNFGGISIECSWDLKRYKFDSIDDFSFFDGKNICDYYINIYFKFGNEDCLIRLQNISCQIQYLTSENIEDKLSIEEIASVLGLSKAKPPIETLKKTVFIAYHFDEIGQYCANQLSLFLGHLGFNVLTGRSFSPQSIKDKVKERMSKQDIVLVIHTDGNDNTWITQETILGAMKKPLIILKQKTAEFKPGILADFEYIEFENNDIQKVFIPLIEGLEELGFSFK